VLPVFAWLRDNGGDDWPDELLALCEGLAVEESSGRPLVVHLEMEHAEPASPRRLAWLLRNRELIKPRRSRAHWDDRRARVDAHSDLDVTLEKLDRGDAGNVARELVLEGKSHADCLIVSERRVIWVEGKRTDWLAEGTDWDERRDQLARNLEAAAAVAARHDVDYCVVLCHETELSAAESALVAGYRDGTLVAGVPHISDADRVAFRRRIGTVRWSQLAARWPSLLQLPQLQDLPNAR
jgi:hypothetical protein